MSGQKSSRQTNRKVGKIWKFRINFIKWAKKREANKKKRLLFLRIKKFLIKLQLCFEGNFFFLFLLFHRLQDFAEWTKWWAENWSCARNVSDRKFPVFGLENKSKLWANEFRLEEAAAAAVGTDDIIDELLKRINYANSCSTLPKPTERIKLVLLQTNNK